MADRRYIVTFGCPDRTGIVARIAGFLAAAGGWIVEAAYHTDRETGWFFTRQEVLAESLPYDATELQSRFAGVATDLAGPDGEADWRISDTGVRRRVAILVSREGPCLYDLLGRVASGELDVDVGAVIGNHTDLADVTRAHGIPFHHVPFPTGDAEGKAAAFQRVRHSVGAARAGGGGLVRLG